MTPALALADIVQKRREIQDLGGLEILQELGRQRQLGGKVPLANPLELFDQKQLNK